MTVGEKIKKYRQLKGMTQWELGAAAGFKENAAVGRISQYETDKVVPRGDAMALIASVLDVEGAALSDINVSSFADVMHVLFEFEEKFGMEIEKREGKTFLVFDDANEEILTLISFLNVWSILRSGFSSRCGKEDPERMKAYARWKGRFTQNIAVYYGIKEMQIYDHYKQTLKNMEDDYPHIRQTSDAVQLLRNLVKSGFTISTRKQADGSGGTAHGFTFVVNELLNPPSGEAGALFALFLYEFQHFQDIGVKCYTDVQMPGRRLAITYFFPLPSFQIVREHVDMLLEFRADPDNTEVILKDMFEHLFDESLKASNREIREEILPANDTGSEG